MGRCNAFVIALCLAMTGLAPRPAAAQPVDFTPAERNVKAMNQAVAMTTSMLVEAFGRDPTTLSVAGTFDDTGWSASLSGTYQAMALSLSFAGTFNPATLSGSYTSTGLVGAEAWNGSGTYSFVDTSVGVSDFFFDDEASVFTVIYDRHRLPGTVYRKQRVDGAIEIRDFAIYRRTIFGLPIGIELVQESLWAYPEDGPDRDRGIATVSLTDELITLTTLVDLGAGTSSGAVTIVPEPASLAMAGPALLAVVALRRRLGRAARVT